ncbi:MAG: response regulator [Actinobacteria bacterium]|uniref:Unannotated protein n=1 Tax=freshwater metagenome TaxID=449393 RepID=A0A6J6TCC2_9ZZZZ|nr:response regulator transcription factor [Actinomycetota bacterium]MSW46918.1 response regulator [Actinomycetota bacterium]MSX24400.1 response regulator [Actinomycetota bacterium]MSY46698.1 response regulator [Actinomycetota bacterium]MSY57038.1 response regulator [Actinomycetota bacterium]
MDESKISILVIDDHQVVREGLKKALEGAGFSVVGEAASKHEAFAQIAHKNPQVIIVDLRLPDGSGLEIVTWAREISPTLGIVVLTLQDEDSFLLAALQAGASAFVVKSAPLSDVIAAVSHSFLSPSSFTAKGLGSAIKRRKEGFKVTNRELQVLALLPQGKSSALIAQELFISETTVKTHLASIYRKLNVANRTEAVVIALKHGLVT